MQRPLLLALLLGFVQDATGIANASEGIVVPHVVAVLEASPKVTHACSELVFSAAKSVESRGEALIFIWGFGSNTLPPLRTDELNAVMEDATKTNSEKLVISPDLLSSAMQAFEYSLYRDATSRLEIRLAVRNDLGNTSEAIASAGIVGSTAQAEPIVVADGESDVTLMYFQELRIGVRTAEAPYALGCANRGAGDSAGSVHLDWDYREIGGNFWAPLQQGATGMGMQDLSMLPNFVRIPAFSMQPGKFYMIRAQASFDQTPSLAPKSSVTFRVAVEDWPKPIVYIEGPQIASTGCSLELDARKSWDPAFGDWSTAASQGVAGLKFRWSCFPVVDVGAPDFCAALPHFTAENIDKTNGQGTKGATLKIRGNQLPPGTYLFSVEVSRVSGQGQSGTARHALEVHAGVFTPLVSILPGFSYSGMTRLQDEVPSVESVVAKDGAAGQDCTLAGVYWQWGLILSAVRPLLIALLPTMREERGGGEVIVRSQSPRAEDEVSLKAGSSYYFVLFQADREASLDELQAGVNVTHKKILSEVLLMDLKVAASTPEFAPDQEPHGGVVSVEPSFAEPALRTHFMVISSQWQDEELNQLEYEFFAFPVLDPSVNLTGNETGLVWRHPMKPQINWDDPEDPHHWLRLGGRHVRSWGPISKAFLHAAPGHHLLVTRVRDVWGMVSTAFAKEPLVVEQLYGYSVDDAKALLARVEATNSANDVLEACAAIQGQTDASRNVEQCRSGGQYEDDICWYVDPAEVAERVLISLQSVPSHLESEFDLLSKAALITERAVESSAVALPVSVDVSHVFGESTRPAPEAIDQGPNATNVTWLPHVSWFNFTAIEIDAKVVVAAEVAIRRALEHLLDVQDEAADVGGLSQQAAEAVLHSITYMLSGMQYAGMEIDEMMTLAPKVRALLEQLSASIFHQLSDGEELQLDHKLLPRASSSVLLSKVYCPASPAGQDIRTPGLKIPRKVANGDGQDQCESLEIIQTTWHSINPHAWAPAGFGETDLILPNTSVEDISFSRCGHPLRSAGLSDPLEIDLEFKPPILLNPGFIVTYKCAFFDSGLGAWSTDGMSLKEAVTDTSTKMTCLSRRSHGSFAAIFSIEEVITNDDTSEESSTEAGEEGLGGGAMAGIVVAAVLVCCGGCAALVFVCRATSTQKVEPDEFDEDGKEDSNSDMTEDLSAVQLAVEEDTDFTRLRKAAEAGEITAAELIQFHSNKHGLLHPELIAAVDSHHMNKKKKRPEDIKPPTNIEILPPASSPVKGKVKIKAKRPNDNASPDNSPSPSPPRVRAKVRPKAPPLEGSRNPRTVPPKHQPGSRSPSPGRRSK